MTALPLAITGSGMVSGVGLDAASTCAAIRAAIDNFQETRFMDAGGEWLLGSEVPLEQPWRGTSKLSKMLAAALTEVRDNHGRLHLEQTPLLLCLAESERPGRQAGMDNKVFFKTQEELDIRFHSQSAIIAQGRVAGATALYRARKLLYEREFPQVIVAGVDSLLSAPTLRELEEQDRLLTSENSDGFIPGEAAAAIVVERPMATDTPQLLCLGLGSGVESATEMSGEPLRAEGLVTAIQAALGECGWDMAALDFRITDNSGTQYYFKEAALALTRLLRERKTEFDIWHPADCIGEVGGAIGPLMLGVILAATEKGFSPGNSILSHVGTPDGKRVAAILCHQQWSAT